MKKSDFQKMIDEAVAKAIKKLLVDTPFFEALMEEAVQKFGAKLKETIVSAGGISLGPKAAPKRSDEFDLSIEDDDEGGVVEDEKERLESAAEGVLARQGAKIREALGGFNPFTEATFEVAAKMPTRQEAQAAERSGTTAVEQNEFGVVVPNDFAEALAQDAKFQSVLKETAATKGSRFEDDPEEEGKPESKKVGRPKKARKVLDDDVTREIMSEAFEGFDE